MASVKVKLRPSTVNGKEGTIYYQVIHKRVIRQIKTDYRILADEWDEKNGAVIMQKQCHPFHKGAYQTGC